MWDLFYFGRNICVATANLQPLGEVIEKEPSGPEGYVYAIINPSFNGLIKLGCASIPLDLVPLDTHATIGQQARLENLSNRILYVSGTSFLGR